MGSSPTKTTTLRLCEASGGRPPIFKPSGIRTELEPYQKYLEHLHINVKGMVNPRPLLFETFEPFAAVTTIYTVIDTKGKVLYAGEDEDKARNVNFAWKTKNPFAYKQYCDVLELLDMKTNAIIRSEKSRELWAIEKLNFLVKNFQATA